MKQYLVERDCHGFLGRYYREGQVVSFEDDVTPPHHFRFLGEDKKPIIETQKQKDEQALSEMISTAKPIRTAGDILARGRKIKIEK